MPDIPEIPLLPLVDLQRQVLDLTLAVAKLCDMVEKLADAVYGKESQSGLQSGLQLQDLREPFPQTGYALNNDGPDHK